MRITALSACIALCAATVLTIGVHADTAKAPEGFQPYPDLPRANDLQLKTTSGRNLRLTELEGKVVLLNFWRTGCPHCTTGRKQMVRMLRRLERDDIVPLAVNLWNSPEIVTRYARKNASSLVFAVGAPGGTSFMKNEVRGRLMGYYVVNGNRDAVYEIKGFPTTFVIDKKGRVVAFHIGRVLWDEAPVRRWIATLAGPKPSAQAGLPVEDDSLHAIERILRIGLDRPSG